MKNNLFWKIGWRYVFRHPWQSALMILGITLGVAVVVAIDLANTSASRAFDLSTETVAGRSTHQIQGSPNGLDESIYTRLKLSGQVEAAAPIISEYVFSSELGDQPLQLLGVDPFAEPPFRSYLVTGEQSPGSARPSPASGDLITFLTRPGAIFISEGLAEQFGLQPGNRLTIELDGRAHQVWITGLLIPSDRLSARALDGLILADIATVQELTGRIGKLDRIDLILPESFPVEKLRSFLPRETRLETVAARNGTLAQMISAFRVNLNALSMLALVVGLFLIYNTMTFSVVQRRPMFGTLRCLGATRNEIFSLVLGEALLVGLLGAAFGLPLGVVLGQGAVQLVTQTINDLFFVVNVRGIQIPPISLVKGAALGIIATVLTALPPAWEAASVPPRAALSRSGLEVKARRAVKLAAAAGGFLLAAGGGILLIPTQDLVISFAGTFAVIVGAAMLAPITTRLLMRLFGPILQRILGILGRMAPRDVINSLSRTSIAVSALMVAVSVTIGVSLMVSSFRHTVVTWLSETLQGDVYISSPGVTSTQSSIEIEPTVIETLERQPGVRQIHVLRSVIVDSSLGPVHIAASSNPTVSRERRYLWSQGPKESIEAAMMSGAVIVSEPFASRYNLPQAPSDLTLYTDQGERTFPIIGIYYDYSSTQGTITMSLDTYQEHWRDPAITAIALQLEPGIDPDQAASQLQAVLHPLGQRLLIRPNQILRQEALAVFDRTFAITGALQLLATGVAFIGVLSALLSLELERQRELGILRAIGLTVRQLWGLIMLETGLLGTAAGLLSMPAGYMLALILVFIINRRSFGWTLQMQVVPDPFIQALVVAVTAALLAGIYPALRMGRMLAADAIRYE